MKQMEFLEVLFVLLALFVVGLTAISYLQDFTYNKPWRGPTCYDRYQNIVACPIEWGGVPPPPSNWTLNISMVKLP